MAIGVTIEPFVVPPARGWMRRRASTDGQRVIAIGDIHGRWDLLETLIRAVEQHVTTGPAIPNQLVFLGDFIDRGPDSRRVVDFLRSAQKNSPRVHVLLGNHEQAMLHSVEGNSDAQGMWLEHGAAATLRSFGADLPHPGEDNYAFGARIAGALGAETIDWLRDLPLSFRLGGYFFCHAGVRPGRSLGKQSVEDLLWIREAFLDSERQHGAVIVHGHSVAEDIEIRPNRIGVDTGAYRTGKLSAVILSDSGNWAISTQDDAAPARRRMTGAHS
ncbi:serine/threonine protein phosphatase [Sphingomonas gei]|uniref:Serine/threonine protein phosphatase n=1 Tax=Sphingomonas gei TaxID=1395960 RepID=A0A4S1XDH1_9SPHN|nr:metallophosphoesterase family protein [Sphingomonas gei]TGX53510.1 serine/threonine protein phosphatase [Sphingomonas gei]